MSRRAVQAGRRAERAATITDDQLYGHVFAEVAGWQESHWAAQHDESAYAEAITSQLGGATAGSTSAERHDIITRAVERYMDDVTVGRPRPSIGLG